MHLQTQLGWPDWDEGREQRLFVSMLLATLLIALGLSLLRLPVFPSFAPIVELLVRIVRESSDEEVPKETTPTEVVPVEQVPDPSTVDETSEPLPQATPTDATAVSAEQTETMAPVLDETTPSDAVELESQVVAPPTTMTPVIELQAARDEAIKQHLDDLENPASVNPNLDAKRREFAGRYQPPTHPGPKPIWENTEVDQLGRTVLRSGDCWKVIADPNVGSQYKFRQFDQYTVMCTYQKRLPKNLPWVAEIVEQYHYLKYPDGIVPEDEAAIGDAVQPAE